jgi:hypothetical protein
MFTNLLILNDQASLSEVVSSQRSNIIVKSLDVGLVKLYFSSSEGKSSLNCFAGKGLRFFDIASSFSANQFEVAFERDGSQLKRSTLIDSEYWDPLVPISVLLKPSRIPVHFEESEFEDSALDISVDTTVQGIVRQLRDIHPMLKSFELFVNGIKATNGLLIDFDHYLENPILVNILSRNGPCPIRFDFYGDEIPVSLHINPVFCRDAMLFFADWLNIPEQALVILGDGRIVPEAERLDSRFVYKITIRNWTKPLKIALHAKGSNGVRLVQEVNIDVGEFLRVCDLLQFFAMFCGLGYISDFVVYSGDASVPLDVLIVALSSNALTIEYQGPVSPCAYFFASPKARDGAVRIRVDDRMRVVNVKLEILKQKGELRTLPCAVDLAFWGCDLKDNDLMLDYGIPSGCRVDVIWHMTDELIVEIDSSEQVYQFAAQDTTSTLQLLFDSSACFVVNGVEFVGRLKELGEKPRLARRKRLKVRLIDGEAILFVENRATVRDAVSILAERFRVSPDRIRLCPIAGDDLNVSEVSCSILNDEPNSREVCAVYKGAQFVSLLSRQMLLSEVRPRLAELFGIQGQFHLNFEDATIVQDIGDVLVISLVLELSVCVGERRCHLSLPSDASLREVEEHVRRECDAESLELMLRSKSTLEAATVGGEVTIGAIDFSTFDLVAQPRRPESSFALTERMRPGR